MKFFLLFIGATFFVFSTLFAQENPTIEKESIVIKAKVVSETDEPLSNVRIQIENKTDFVQTDKYGNYEIQVQKGDKLLFRLEGFQDQLFVIKDQASYNVTLYEIPRVKESANQELKEVVVTAALGRKVSKKKLGYSTQEVKSKELNEGQPTNAFGALSGRVAGVNINNSSSSLGGSTRIVIRGENSIKGNNQPLIVIDGVPIDNSNYNSYDVNRGVGGVDFGDPLSDINPQDIENVSVLKGGAASALYGSRAVNGAIIVTTKRASRERESIQFSSSTQFTQVYNLPRLQKKYGGGTHTITSESIGDFIKHKEGKIIDPSSEHSWGPAFNPAIQYLPWHAIYTGDRTLVPYVAPKYDVEDFFRVAPTYTNSLSFAKSFEKSALNSSLSHMKQEGVLYNSYIERINFSLSGNTKLFDRLKLQADMKYISNKSFNKPEIGIYGDMTYLFMVGRRELDWRTLKNHYQNLDGSQKSPYRNSFEEKKASADNSYWNQYKNYSDSYRDNFIGSTSLTYQIIKGLSIRGRIMGNFYNDIRKYRTAVHSAGQPEYKEEKREMKDFNYETMLNYDSDLGKDFHLSSFLRLNRWDHKRNKLFAQTQGELRSPEIYTLANGMERPVSNHSLHHKRINTLSANANIGYKDFLYLDLSATNDWSSALPEANNSYFYPAAALSWLFSKHIELSWLTFGKLRISASQVGNDLDPYKVREIYKIENPFRGLGRSSIPSTYLNPNLKPEMQKAWEIGGEFGLLKNRITLDITYYSKSTLDQILDPEVPLSTGYEKIWTNIGKVNNRGVEIMLGVIPIKNKDFSWNTDINFSRNLNRVKNLDTGYILIGLTAYDPNLAAIEGKTSKELWGRDFTYDAKGRKIIDEDGFYLASKEKSLGSIFPDFRLGINNKFVYKNFDLSFLIDMQKGGVFSSPTYAYSMVYGLHADSAIGNKREEGVVLDGVKKDGTVNSTKISMREYANRFNPSLNNSVHPQAVFDASYIKLRTLALGYNFDFKNQEKRTFKSLRLSVFGTNLFVLGPAAKKGLDAESATTGSGNMQGFEIGGLPIARTYGLNLQLNF